MIPDRDNGPRSPLPRLPTEGECVAGKYQIKERIGVGGMGVVLAAHHRQLDQPVAIKFLRPEEASNPDSNQRFLREARAAVRIQCEHGVRIMDVGTLDSGIPFMVMELLLGEDLGQILCAGPLAIEDAAEYVLQASEAVSEAHMRGIIHRDLKPSNLFITHRPDGSVLVKVLDFGISKAPGLKGGDTHNAQHTGSHLLLGSPYYMAPEQLHDASSVDARTDIWALGAILYEAVTGTQPFKGTTLPALCAQILCAPPIPVRELREGIPAGLESLIKRCLSVDRSQRYRSVGEMASDLVEYGPPRSKASVERILGLERGATHQAGSPVDRAERISPKEDNTTWRETLRGNRNRVASAMSAAIALAFLGGIAALVASTRAVQTDTPVSPRDATDLVQGSCSLAIAPTNATPSILVPALAASDLSAIAPPQALEAPRRSSDKARNSQRMYQPAAVSADGLRDPDGKPTSIQAPVDPLGDRK